MLALIYNDTQINYELSKDYGKLFLNSDVCLGYGISKQALNDNLKRNQDELQEGTHYIYDYAMTNGGRQRVIKWTSLGVYHLGFFIKSKQAKEFRKFMGNVANTLDPFKINDKRVETTIQIELSKLNQEIKDLKNQLALKVQEEVNPFRGFYTPNWTFRKRENEYAYTRKDLMLLLNECERTLVYERQHRSHTKQLSYKGGNLI
ncbi:hypothetical protein N5U26_06495 [Aliarcobacter cryaerophilus]|uniref:hypothetical protein n=1 Tax=Aliarcobacter cryaerophilus TaxID=28198 RepID=UPI0021B56B4E|nr:hypothetical protein [Aliarcobacter cryaerophilus]MCT7509992.1 hypothetical protein [Aliarcobacter cryaerophilus]